MKALFVSNDPAIFDSTSSVHARMNEYANAIGTLHIVMRTDAPSRDQTTGSLTVHGVSAGKLEGARALAKKVNELIRTHGIEVVSAQDPFEHGWAAKEAVKGTNAKLHIQVHTDFLSPWFVRGGIFRSPQLSIPAKNRMRRVLADRVLPHADGIRVVSERVKASLVKRYGARIPEPTVLPIAVGTIVPEAVPLPPHPFPFALITVGRLEPEKRIEDIIEALVRIRKLYPTVGLVIVGDGRERASLEALVLRKGLGENVIFMGNRPDVWGLMRSAQCYIQASSYEGYGRTLVEAALARVPIITTDVGIVGEVFTGYENVLAAPPGDPTQLAFHVRTLLEDVATGQRMIRSAETKALAHVERYAHLAELIASDLSHTLESSKS